MRKYFLRFLFLVLIFLFSSNSFAQEKDSIYITGTIVDENNSPLSDAYVGIVETSKGVFTDNEGKYKLNVTQPLDSLKKITLRYEFVGYQEIEKEIDSTILSPDKSKEIDVKLEDEVIIICYSVPSPKKDSIYITGTIVDENNYPLSDAYVGIV
ncbi:carboxypeptidase-like regulatory domain-containing protein [Weeksellaceae bacterium TAE3-ERU29]|nr:carboxypeptidase-like regulatory domain-containing protein [Weeksellaceae bacterium TAE3-ERU29]